MRRIVLKNQEVTFKVFAEEYLSTAYIQVDVGDQYEFNVDPNDYWVDSFIRKNANGFWNILLSNSKKRLKNQNCFLLCGTIGEDEEGHFSIGTKKIWTATKAGKLLFFANDHINKKYYQNNKGSILIIL